MNPTFRRVNLRPSVIAVAVAALSAALTLDGTVIVNAAATVESAGAGAAQAPAPPVLTPGGALADRFRPAGERLRSGDCAGARRALAAHTAEGDPDAAAARLLAGFFAHACGDFAAAVEPLRRSLRGAQGEIAALEDWRLLLLALDARVTGQTVLALAAFERLIGDHPASPLWPTAVVEAASTARDVGQLERAADWIERGLKPGSVVGRDLADEPRRALARLAWEVARARGEGASQRAAARRLLVEFPFDAAELQAVDALRVQNGFVDWYGELGAGALERRATNLVDLGVAAGALAALDAIPAGERGGAWRLLRARALVLDHQAREALHVLDGESGGKSATKEPASGEREWVRALAYGELLLPSGGGARDRARPAIAEAERFAFEQARRDSLWSVAGDAATALGVRQGALRLLFADLAQAELHDETRRALVQLRILDPEDLSGARELRERGGNARRDGEDPAASQEAIDRWHQLIQTYPESRYARSAQYWTARARERLGELGPASASYRALAAADTSDFYRRHALVRLRHPSLQGTPTQDVSLDAALGGGSGTAPARASWPVPAALERAHLLSDLGLDALARIELDAVEATIQALDRKAMLAARALVASRLGERRESLRLLREAFPALGSAHQADLPEAALRLFYPLDFEPTVRAMAKAQGLPPSLVFGIIHQESGFDAKAVSRSGARGLMQLMPATARELSRKLGMRYSLAELGRPETSVRLGTAYLRHVLGMFDGNLELALVGYNSGPYRIRKLWHGDASEIDAFVEDLSPDEPKIYVKRILALADTYRRLHPQLG